MLVHQAPGPTNWVKASQGNLNSAADLLDWLTRRRLLNCRTLATFFRGCLRWGALPAALARYYEWRELGLTHGGGAEESGSGGTAGGDFHFDYASLEYLVTLCLQLSRTKEAMRIYRDFERQVLLPAGPPGGGSTGLLRRSHAGVYARLQLALARTRMLSGQLPAARRALARVAK
ncbi:unnamed protein product, partial [Prorocentrum cordatum]